MVVESKQRRGARRVERVDCEHVPVPALRAEVPPRTLTALTAPMAFSNTTSSPLNSALHPHPHR